MPTVFNVLTTGTPQGNVVYQEATYLEGAPVMFYQDYNANPLFNPDANGFYWNMSGTTTYPVYTLGCIQSVKMQGKITMADVRCDTFGVTDTIQKLDYIEFDLTLLSLLPLSQLKYLLKFGTTAVVSGHTETSGIAQVNNNQKFMLYAPKVYDENNGYWLAFHIHKCKFVDTFTVDMKYGAAWEATGIKIRGYADTSKPANQRFGTIFRADSSAL